MKVLEESKEEESSEDEDEEEKDEIANLAEKISKAWIRKRRRKCSLLRKTRKESHSKMRSLAMNTKNLNS